MIRFIDLRHVSDDIEGDRFAFYDTVTDRFIADVMGCQTWGTIGEFAQVYHGDDLSRFVEVMPEWAKHAVPEREIFKVEILPAQEMPNFPPGTGSVHQASMGHASNKSESAECEVPLSPVVLQAMQGRQAAYFYGVETYGLDEEIGAITGTIVIDFEAEAKGASW